jgi:hypothetical protein
MQFVLKFSALVLLPISSAFAAPMILPIGPPGPPLYHAEVDFPTASPAGNQSFTSDSNPITPSAQVPSHSVNDSVGNSGSGSAQASQDSLKGLTSINAGTTSFSGNTISTLRMTDLQFTGSTPTVQTSINLHIDGSFSVNGNAGINNTSQANVGVTYKIFLPNNISTTPDFTETGVASLREVVGPNVNNSSTNFTGLSSGLLSGAIASNPSQFPQSSLTAPVANFNFTTASFSVPAGLTLATAPNITLVLELDTSATATKGAGASFGPSATSDFSHTFDFDSSKNAFNNDGSVSGFTANSVQGGVLLNQTPEPVGLAMIALAASALARRRHR